jgi:PEGA domain-containing protein
VLIPSVRDRASRGRPLSSWGRPLAACLSLSLGLGVPLPGVAQAAPPASGGVAPAPHAAKPGAAPDTPAPAAPGGGTREQPPKPPEPSAAPAPLAESLQGMARADYAAARILYEDGDYPGALTKLESAYAASKDPRLLWNMAACAKALRHYASVIDLLERYLVEGSRMIGTEEREATSQLVETVQEFVNELRLDVQPEGVDVWVDGSKLVTTPLARPLRLDMGKRQLRLEKPGFQTYTTELDLAGGKSVDMKVTLAPEVHEGTLRVVSDPSAVISIDGHVVGTASWSGPLSSGVHRVSVSANGKQSYDTDVIVKDHDTNALHVNLQDEPKNVLLRQNEPSGSALWWVVGGVALAGAGVGAYFLMRPDSEPTGPDGYTWAKIDL